MKDEIPEINLKLTTVTVKAQSRPLKEGFNYKLGMFEKEIKSFIEEIKAELKFHGFTIKLDDLEEKTTEFGQTATVHNIKENITMGLLLEDFIHYDLDGAIEFITACVSQENLDAIEDDVDNYLTDEDIEEIMKTLSDEERERFTIADMENLLKTKNQ